MDDFLVVRIKRASQRAAAQKPLQLSSFPDILTLCDKRNNSIKRKPRYCPKAAQAQQDRKQQQQQ